MTVDWQRPGTVNLTHYWLHTYGGILQYLWGEIEVSEFRANADRGPLAFLDAWLTQQTLAQGELTRAQVFHSGVGHLPEIQNRYYLKIRNRYRSNRFVRSAGFRSGVPPQTLAMKRHNFCSLSSGVSACRE